MGTGQVITNDGKNLIMNRTFEATPSYTEPSLFQVGIGTDTPAVNDTAMEDPVTINGGDTKAFAATYPQYDTTNFMVTIRCVLTTAEANGNDLSEFGIINTDGTPILFSHVVYTAITKDANTQITYIEKDRLI